MAASAARERPYFPWTKSIETGIRVIDQDHRLLVGLINEMYRAEKSGRFEQELVPLLANLFDYCTDHFFREEKIMEEYGYPDLAVHRERHRGIRRFVHALRIVGTEDPRRIDPDKLLLFLRDWLENHIARADMAYVAHIHAAMSGNAVPMEASSLEQALSERGNPELVSLEVEVPNNLALSIKQAADIMCGRISGALALDQEIQSIINASTFKLPKSECYQLVRDLLR